MKESYYMRNRERRLAYQREYYQDHRAECLERIKASTKRRTERERRRAAKIKIKIDMDEDKKLCAICRRYNPISYKGEDKIYHYCQYGDMCYPCSGCLCNYHERFERVE